MVCNRTLLFTCKRSIVSRALDDLPALFKKTFQFKFLVAAYEGRAEVVVLLLAKGASASILNSSGAAAKADARPIAYKILDNWAPEDVRTKTKKENNHDDFTRLSRWVFVPSQSLELIFSETFSRSSSSTATMGPINGRSIPSTAQIKRMCSLDS